MLVDFFSGIQQGIVGHLHSKGIGPATLIDFSKKKQYKATTKVQSSITGQNRTMRKAETYRQDEANIVPHMPWASNWFNFFLWIDIEKKIFDFFLKKKGGGGD